MHPEHSADALRPGEATHGAGAAPWRVRAGAAVRRRLRWLLPLAVLAAGGVLAAALVAVRPIAEANPPEILPPLVRVETARPEPHTLTVEAHGTVEPRTESALVAEAAGRVLWVAPAFESGGFFEAGEALLRLDAREQEAALARAQAQLQRAESEAELARLTLARREELARRDAVSPATLDEARAAARVAEAAVGEARAALAQARLDLDRTTIVAPFAGRVREAGADVGQFVARGTALGRIYATDAAEVRLPITMTQLAYLELPLDSMAGIGTGPEVTLVADLAGERHRWHGRIVRTEGAIDARTRTVQAVARVDDPFGRAPGAPERPPLAPGLFVTAEIAGRNVARAVALPRVALRDDGSLFVVDADDRLRRREVEVLRSSRDTVLVAGGLEAGERVLVSAPAAATEGMQVRTAGARTP